MKERDGGPGTKPVSNCLSSLGMQKGHHGPRKRGKNGFWPHHLQGETKLQAHYDPSLMNWKFEIRED
jgi:hypothetical protein